MKASIYTLVVALSLCTLATAPHAQTDIAAETADELFAHLQGYSGSTRDEQWREFQGRFVRWNGSPRAFGTRRKKRHRFLIDLKSEGNDGEIWIRACFRETEAEELRELTQYDSIVFVGRLAKFSASPSPHSPYHFLIEDARLVEVIKARSILSIVSHNLSRRPSRLLGDRELWELEVTLRNEGGRPLTDATLEAEFRRAKGTKEGVKVDSQSNQTVRIRLMEQWAVGGKKQPSDENASGLHHGIIRLKDKNGLILMSKPFSEKLPRTE